MSPRNEELLYFLLWTADTFMRPTWRNVSDPFESWAWRNGLGRRLAELECKKLVERHPDPDLERVVRLTEAGRCRALGGRDPTAQWSRPWDGRWRFVLFDLPAKRTDLRSRLWRTLRWKSHFGYLQNSVWISPDPAGDIRKIIGGAKVQPDAFLIMEGRPAAGESDAEIVSAAWDFSAVNRRYEQYLTTVKKFPAPGASLVAWARQENAAWQSAVEIDPLLPSGLLPAGYLGRQAIHERKKVLARLARTEREPGTMVKNHATIVA